jgi:hypothetical protein
MKFFANVFGRRARQKITRHQRPNALIFLEIRPFLIVSIMNLNNSPAIIRGLAPADDQRLVLNGRRV